MRVWKVVLLLNLALALGVGWGWAWWGRRAVALDRELGATRARLERMEREAPRVPPGAAASQRWEVRGVVRAVLPDMNVLVVTHEDIPGYMTSMTMGFRVAAPAIHQSLQVGDAVRFTLQGTPPDVVVTAIEKSR